jgi:hypothetical protein
MVGSVQSYDRLSGYADAAAGVTTGTLEIAYEI